MAPAHEFQRADAVAGRDHLKSGYPKVVAGDLGNLRLVIDDQNLFHARGTPDRSRNHNDASRGRARRSHE